MIDRSVRGKIRALASWRNSRDEWPTVLCYAVDGSDQLVHGGDRCNLRPFASRAKSLIVSSQPRIDTDRNQNRHPERASESGVAEGNRTRPRKLPFPRLMDTRDNTDITGEGRCVWKARRIASLADYRGGGQGAHTLNRRQELPEIAGLEPDAEYRLRARRLARASRLCLGKRNGPEVRKARFGTGPPTLLRL